MHRRITQKILVETWFDIWYAIYDKVEDKLEPDFKTIKDHLNINPL